MLKPFGFRRLAILSIVLAAPALLRGGANTWTGSGRGGASLSSPDLVASSGRRSGSRVLRAGPGPLPKHRRRAHLEPRRLLRPDRLALRGSGVGGRPARRPATGPAALPGIYKSSDGGAMWRQTLSLSDGAINASSREAPGPRPRSTRPPTGSSISAATAARRGNRSTVPPARTGVSRSRSHRSSSIRWTGPSTPGATTSIPATTAAFRSDRFCDIAATRDTAGRTSRAAGPAD